MHGTLLAICAHFYYLVALAVKRVCDLCTHTSLMQAATILVALIRSQYFILIGIFSALRLPNGR